jgi:tetratricopeptide (TPR) repeat protein
MVGLLVLLLFCFAGSLLAEDAELSPTEGIDRYEDLVRLYPQKAVYRNALGYYYLKAENYQKAQTCFLAALELDSSYATAHNNLGVVYLHQERPEQAEKEFRRALELNPNYCKAQYNLAVALFRQRRYRQAARAYLRAREMDRNYVERRDNQEKMQQEAKQALKQFGEDDGSARTLKRLKQWFAPYY